MYMTYHVPRHPEAHMATRVEASIVGFPSRGVCPAAYSYLIVIVPPNSKICISKYPADHRWLVSWFLVHVVCIESATSSVVASRERIDTDCSVFDQIVEAASITGRTNVCPDAAYSRPPGCGSHGAHHIRLLHVAAVPLQELFATSSE